MGYFPLGLKLLEVHRDFPTIPHYPEIISGSLTESNPMNGFAHDIFPSQFPTCTTGTLCPSTAHSSFVWAGPGQLFDSLVLTSQVASYKFASQCFYVLALVAFSTVFNSPLYPSVFSEPGS